MGRWADASAHRRRLMARPAYRPTGKCSLTSESPRPASRIAEVRSTRPPAGGTPQQVTANQDVSCPVSPTVRLSYLLRRWKPTRRRSLGLRCRSRRRATGARAPIRRLHRQHEDERRRLFGDRRPVCTGTCSDPSADGAETGDRRKALTGRSRSILPVEGFCSLRQTRPTG
jgi:hypothetical protein